MAGHSTGPGKPGRGCWGMFSCLWDSGPLIISLAAFVCSIIPLCVKQLHGIIHPSQITLISSSIAWLVTHALLYLAGEDLVSLVTSGKSALLISRGLLGGCVQICYYAAVQMLPLSAAVSLFFVNPAMAVLLDWVIYRKRVSLAALLGCLATIGGVFLITHPTCSFCITPEALPSHRLHVAGVLVALLAAAANAAAFVSIQAIGPGVPFVLLMYFYHAMAVAAAGASFLAAGAAWVVPSGQQVQWVLGVAAANFLGQLLLNRGFQRCGAANGASINTQQVLYAYLWNIAIFHQPLQLCAAAGSCCILGGVVAVSEGSSYSQAASQLERDRSQQALEHRLLAGRLSFIDRVRGRGLAEQEDLLLGLKGADSGGAGGSLLGSGQQGGRDVWEDAGEPGGSAGIRQTWVRAKGAWLAGAAAADTSGSAGPVHSGSSSSKGHVKEGLAEPLLEGGDEEEGAAGRGGDDRQQSRDQGHA